MNSTIWEQWCSFVLLCPEPDFHFSRLPRLQFYSCYSLPSCQIQLIHCLMFVAIFFQIYDALNCSNPWQLVPGLIHSWVILECGLLSLVSRDMIVRIVPVVSKQMFRRSGRSYGTLPRRSQTTRTTETTSIAWIELSSIRTIGTIVWILNRPGR